MSTRPSVIYPVLLLSHEYIFRGESAVALFVVDMSRAKRLIYGAKGPRKTDLTTLTYVSTSTDMSFTVTTSDTTDSPAGGEEVG